MICQPMDILSQFPIRKTKEQKLAFREAVCPYAEKLGYPVTVEEGKFGCRNVIFGNPEEAHYLVTAHYDTPARSVIPNFCAPASFGLWIARRFLSLALMALITLAASAFTDNGWLIALAVIGTAACIDGLLLMGPANKNNVNDNSSGVITVLEIMKTLPQSQRHKVCFVLFDREEQGLVGSGQYRKAHKAATEQQLVLNLDCVGDGDHIRMFPTKKLRQDRVKCTSLYAACGYFGKKDILVHEKGFYRYASDQNRFPYAVAVCALTRRKKLLYLSRIHTDKDTVLDINNVNLLRAALTSYICRDASEIRKEMEK